METKVNFFTFRLQHYFFFILFTFFILLAYLFYLQVARGKYFYQISENNRREIYLQSVPRGIIYDRRGKILADSRPVNVLLLSLQNLNEETLGETLKQLKKLLNFSEKEIREKINLEKGKLLLRLKEEISRKEMFKLEENRTNLPGINIQQIELKRRYPLNSFAAHVLGYIGEIDREELDKLFLEGYRLGDLVGKEGVEAAYDGYLRGEPGGMEIEVDARGRQKRVIRNFSPGLGKSLVLTLDSELQQCAEEELRSRGWKGAIILLEPQTGEILALVSSPGYDPNVLIDFKRPKKIRELLNDPSLPLFNRAIQGLYPPSSVFKIVTAIAAFEEKKVNLEKEFYCPGSLSIGKYTYRCWKRDGHGWVSFFPALIHSCDVYFYLLGLECGADLLEKYAKKFGLDTLSQIDLPGEKEGLIPGKIWKKRSLGESWYHGDTVNFSIGQGYVLLTPLSSANLAAILANRGKLYQPHIVKKIIDEEKVNQPKIIWEVEPKEILHVELREDTWKIINEGLKRAVAEGTGRTGAIVGLDIAAKTGTAQNPHGEDHGWFVGYAPAENPKIVFVIFVEHCGPGGPAVAPLARRLILTYLKEKNEQGNTHFLLTEK